MHQWADYFVAMAGAAGALTGLIFVGLSLSLNKVLALPELVDRGMESMIMLVNILIISSLCLIPEQPVWLLGSEILGVAIIVWLMVLRLDMRMLRITTDQYRRLYVFNIFISQISVCLFIVAAIIILCIGPPGIYWLIPAITISLVKSLTDAWVLLIEINR